MVQTLLQQQSVGGKRLRDLSEQEFLERYKCDRFTATVLSNRFVYVIDNIKGQLLRTAFSPIVRIGDFAIGLSGPPSERWPMVAVSQTCPLHVGSLPDAVRIMLEEYGLSRLEPGDVIVCNDYFRVGTHLNDVVFIRPLILDGNILGALALRCHQTDMGGVARGGFHANKRNRFEDGFAVPPMRLFAHGDIVPEVAKLFMANTRAGALMLNDMRVIDACLREGERLIAESVQKSGREAYLGAVQYTDDVSAETMSQALLALPDGVYEGEETIDTDFLPHSPEYRVKIRVIKRGALAEVDLSGSSEASRSTLNSCWPDARTGIAIGLKSLIDRHSRYTSGSLRPIDVVLPPNSIVNPDYPHACQSYAIVVVTVIMALFNALNPVLGEDAVGHDVGAASGTVSGTTADGQAEMLESGAYTLGSGIKPMGETPWGASRYGDGMSTSDCIVHNIRPQYDEAVGNRGQVPLSAVVINHGIVPDTGGPGKFRGGVASFTDVQWLIPTTQSSTNPYMRRPRAGVYGGHAGRLGATWVWSSDNASFSAEAISSAGVRGAIYAESLPVSGVLDPDSLELDPEGTYFSNDRPIAVPAGSVVRRLANGAGGWGDPLERDTQLVLRDVRDGYVSIPGARRDYAVEIVGDAESDPEGLYVDQRETDRLRLERRQVL